MHTEWMLYIIQFGAVELLLHALWILKWIVSTAAVPALINKYVVYVGFYKWSNLLQWLRFYDLNQNEKHTEERVKNESEYTYMWTQQQQREISRMQQINITAKELNGEAKLNTQYRTQSQMQIKIVRSTISNSVGITYVLLTNSVCLWIFGRI